MVDEESQPAQPATELLCDLCRRKGDPEHFIRMLCPGCLNGCAGLNPTAYRECVAALHALTTAILFEGEEQHYNAVIDKCVANAHQALAHAEAQS